MIPEAAAIWLEGYKAGVRDADRDRKLREVGGFLRFDELEANPYDEAVNRLRNGSDSATNT